MIRQIRNPEKWIGKPAKNVNYDPHWRTIDKCDACQRLQRAGDLHSLLWPQCPADFALQKAVKVEEAESYCPDCLAEIETDADKIDPEWRQRHGLI